MLTCTAQEAMVTYVVSHAEWILFGHPSLAISCSTSYCYCKGSLYLLIACNNGRSARLRVAVRNWILMSSGSEDVRILFFAPPRSALLRVCTIVRSVYLNLRSPLYHPSVFLPEKSPVESSSSLLTAFPRTDWCSMRCKIHHCPLRLGLSSVK